MLFVAATRTSPEGWKSREEMAVVRCSSDLTGSGVILGIEVREDVGGAMSEDVE